MPNAPEIIPQTTKEIIEKVPGPTTRPFVEEVLNNKPAESTTRNTFLGNKAVAGIKPKGEANIGFGEEALISATTAANCQAIGSSALSALQIGENNTAIGGSSLVNLQEGTGNIGIGFEAGQAVKEVNSNIFIGHKAAKEIELPTGTIAIGEEAAKKAASANVIVGHKAGKTASAENVVIGTEANTVEGSGSTIVGHKAGEKLKGSKNICLGYEAGASATAKEKLFIGNGQTATPVILGNLKTAELELQFNVEKMGFFKTTPASQEKVAAAASNLGTAETLANSLRTMVIKLGLMKE